MKEWIKRPGIVVALVAVMASVALFAAACGSDDAAAPAAPAQPAAAAPAAAAAAPPPGAAAAPPPPGAKAAATPKPAAKAAAAAAPPPPPPPPGAVAQPTKAPKARATAVPKASTGTIPGTTITVAAFSIGRTTQEAVESPYDASRPGSNLTKDDILLIDPTGTLIPHVVKSWDFGAKTKSWTLNMRDDIAFPAYNRNANSADLIWSIYEGHWTGFKSGGSTSRSFQTSVPTAVDAHTVKIEFEQATFGVAYDGFTVREETTHLTPAAELLAMGNGDSTAGWAAFMALEPGPISSGAYQYTRQVPQEFNEYKVNTKWFGPAPDFEKFIFQEVKEPGTRLALLATEKADVINLSAPTLVQANSIDHTLVLANPYSVFVQFFFLNLWEEGHPAYDSKVVFLDKRVRTAFNISVNRAEINEVIYGGASNHQDAPILNPVKFAWDHPIVKEMRDNPIPYDIAAAKALLVESGIDLSKEIPAAQRGASSAVPEWPELNEAVVNGWIKDLGANVVLEQTKENVYSQLHNGQSVKWWLWGGERIGGAGRHSLGPARYFGPGSVNFAASHWDQISDMREMALGAEDFEVYKEWNAKISKLQRDEAIMIPIMVNPIYYGANKNRIASWPMTPGITREHYMEHIRANPALRKAQ